MRYLIAILIICSISTAVGEDIFKPTGRYAEKSVEIKSTDLNFKLQIWKAVWCTACPKGLEEAQAAASELGITLEEIDYDSYQEFAKVAEVRSLPTVCIISEKGIHDRIKEGNRNDITQSVRKLMRAWKGKAHLVPDAHPRQIAVTPDNGKSVVILETTDNPTRFGFSSKSQSTFIRDPAKRYAVWNGVQYDLEEWQRQCSMRNCQMCIYLDNAQAIYFSSAIPVQAEAPSPQSSSPVDVVDEAIAIANLSPSDVVGELGSGNGLTAIRMVKASGCRVVGVEIDPAKVAESRANIDAAGLSDRITIIEGDVRQFDPIKYGITVIYAYLYDDLLNEIKSILSAGRIAICPGHKPEGLGMELVGQCWVRKNNS